MANYDKIKNLNNEDFKLFTGLKKETFNLALKHLKEAQANKKQSGQWQEGILTTEDRLLMTLQYYRENRTMFHIGIEFGVLKSTVSKTIRWVENILSKCKEFKLSSKRRILDSDMEFEVFVIDATESPIERPTSKKNLKKETTSKNNYIRAKRKSIR